MSRTIISHVALAAVSIVSTPICMVSGALMVTINTIKALILKLALNLYRQESEDLSKTKEEQDPWRAKIKPCQEGLDKLTYTIKLTAKLLIPLGGFYWAVLSVHNNRIKQLPVT